jgi:hypothetical protein
MLSHQMQPNGSVTIERAFEIAKEACEIARLAYDTSRNSAAKIETHEAVCTERYSRINAALGYLRGDIATTAVAVSSMKDAQHALHIKILLVVISGGLATLGVLAGILYTSLPTIAKAALASGTVPQP